MADGDAIYEADKQELGLYPARRFTKDGRLGRYGYLHLQIPEYSHGVYCDATYSRPLSGVRAKANIAGP